MTTPVWRIPLLLASSTMDGVSLHLRRRLILVLAADSATEVPSLRDLDLP